MVKVKEDLTGKTFGRLVVQKQIEDHIYPNEEHTLLCIIGKTACGKDTLVNKLCERKGYQKLLSYATRSPRKNEENTHIFVTESDYKQMKANNQVAADTCINGNYYWATIEQLYQVDCYIIDCVGWNKLKELNLPNLRLVSVYINTPDNIRQERATKQRGDDINTFRARNLDERQQFRKFLQNAEFDYAIKNDSLANAYSVLKWICDVEGLWKNKEDE